MGLTNFLDGSMRVKKRIIFLTFFLSFIFSCQISLYAQSTEDLKFEEALQGYINKNLLSFGKNEIAGAGNVPIGIKG